MQGTKCHAGLMRFSDLINLNQSRSLLQVNVRFRELAVDIDLHII